MAHGVEARVPFASMEVLRVVRDVAPQQGFAQGVEKALLRRAARPLVPASVCERKKSALPRDPRLGPLYQRALSRLLEEEADFAHHTLDVPTVRALCRVPVVDDNTRGLLFNLLALLHWKRQHLG